MNEQPRAENPNWGPFGRPLFNDPSSRALSRVGVVDVGSNSVRLVVFDGAARSPAYFYNEKIMCALGEGLAETGRLSPRGRERALNAIRRFQEIARGLRLPPLIAVATAAVRDAEDGQDFCDEVLRETGLRIWIIDGDEEARLSAQGVLLGWPGAYGLVCDMGGASMELAEIDGNTVGKRMTSPLGPLKLRHIKGGRRARKAVIKDVVEDMRRQMGKQRDRLFLVGGSWRAIARIDMARRGYPLTVLHEYRMTAKSVRDTLHFIEKSDLEKLRNRAVVSAARMELVPIAIDVLHRLVRTFKPHDIAISSYGIREGLLYEQMPQELRDRDPLIEACWFAEAKDARMPGFGRKLFDFVMPLFRSAKPSRVRIIKAACLLHDVSWRAHPDYRADVCFDYATRANLGGLKHSERVFLGLALQHRYRNKRPSERFGAFYDLIDDRSGKEAEILGKAMRLGAMLWMQPDTAIGELRFQPKKKRLELVLPPEAEPLFGEVAEARLMSLAQALEAEVSVTFKT
ncbi:Ppx/GppA family phosphatase [Jhaorihella thermophila]|uniref:Exopolyphosphatase / guanosine-5'-triphosphate,3'-diphosphate pyrophosphatase n=1 Tax=Jhaorihella thermophila TaxID=488547 RepID=A0A1H5Y4N9_9RHOB|nr:Ppx/GppA family phosphatase [Jhaorihella thermophila]SEG18667.1 exopolyphosphatase / guanosine-5'-triphosphate,3'-diphosphate pyrophosphatase [Jhaorihella thermophila]